MHVKNRIPFREGKAKELIDLLSTDESFRTRMQQDPKEALKDYVVNVDDVPDECGELPSTEEIENKRDEILEEQERNGFVGHWPFLWR